MVQVSRIGLQSPQLQSIRKAGRAQSCVRQSRRAEQGSLARCMGPECVQRKARQSEGTGVESDLDRGKQESRRGHGCQETRPELCVVLVY